MKFRLITNHRNWSIGANFQLYDDKTRAFKLGFWRWILEVVWNG